MEFTIHFGQKFTDCSVHATTRFEAEACFHALCRVYTRVILMHNLGDTCKELRSYDNT